MNNDYIRQRSIPFDVKLRSLVQDIKFNCIGTVSSVNSDGTRVDVTLPYLSANAQPIVLKGIEVLIPGTNAVKVRYKPTEGDVALVFALQDYWAEVEYAHSAERSSVCAEPYSNVTMKAILVQSNKENSDATTIEVTEEEINIKTKLAINVTTEDKLTINDHLTVE